MKNEKINNTAKGKEALLKAKTLVIQGANLKEASEQTGASIDSLKKHSAKENWIKQQQNFIGEMTVSLIEKYGEQHIEDREQAFIFFSEMIKKITEQAEKEELSLETLKIYEKIIDLIKKCIDGENYLLGISKIEVLHKQYFTQMNINLRREANAKPKQNANIFTRVINLDNLEHII